jgi:tight adherence protein B
MPPTVILVSVFALAIISVAAIALVLAGGDGRSRQRLAALGVGQASGGETAVVRSGLRSDSAPTLTHLLQNSAWAQNLQLQIIRAGWLLRSGEYIAITLGAAVACTGLAWLLSHNLVMGCVVGGMTALVPNSMLKSQQQRRIKTLSAQLPDALDMLAGSLRSGFSVLRAMQVVRTQMHPPIAHELGRVVDEVQYGIPMEHALDNLIARTGSYDLELIVAAIQTQLTVGGNLAEIFDSIAEMIRERVKLLGEMQAATAEGRLSAGILVAMPFGMALIVNTMSPGYLAPLFHTQLGLVLIGVGASLMVVGGLVMRKLIDIDV